MNEQSTSSARDWKTSAVKGFLVAMALDIFLVSINLLGVFKSSGRDYFEVMIAQLAVHPFLGLLIGILSTSVFQSSSTTTSLVVGLVGSNFLQLPMDQTLQAIVPIIMGANIGTSVTNMLVSIGHIGNRQEFERAFGAATVHDLFNFMCVILFLPIQAATNFLGKAAIFFANLFEKTGGLKIGSPLKMAVKPQVAWIRDLYDHTFLIHVTVVFFAVLCTLLVLRLLSRRWGKYLTANGMNVLTALIAGLLIATFVRFADLVFRKEVAVMVLALGAMFSSLLALVQLMKAIMLSRLEVLFHRYVFKTALRSLIMGCLFTVLVQSSSVTTSLVVPIAGAGILSIYQIFPFTLGANVGTTITAILAALSTGQVAAIAVAFSHLLFNLLGLAVFYFHPMRLVPIRAAQLFAKYGAQYRYLPLAYILLIFFVLPFSLIYLF